MAKEDSEKKWLAILVVLMVVVLVVDLLSLNVLYKLTKESELDGELAARKPRTPCEECQKTKEECLHFCDKRNPIGKCYTACFANYDSCLYSYGCQN